MGNDKTQSVKCDQCDKNASCNTNLRKRVMTKHMKLVKHITFKFNVCKQNHDNKKFITNHMISVHDPPGGIYYCELCESVTSIKTGLDIHISKKHK